MWDSNASWHLIGHLFDLCLCTHRQYKCITISDSNLISLQHPHTLKKICYFKEHKSRTQCLSIWIIPMIISISPSFLGSELARNVLLSDELTFTSYLPWCMMCTGPFLSINKKQNGIKVSFFHIWIANHDAQVGGETKLVIDLSNQKTTMPGDNLAS